MRSKKQFITIMSEDTGIRDQEHLADVFRGVLAVVVLANRFPVIAHLRTGMVLPGYFSSKDNARELAAVLAEGYQKDLAACTNQKQIPPGFQKYYARKFLELEGIDYNTRKVELHEAL